MVVVCEQDLGSKVLLAHDSGLFRFENSYVGCHGSTSSNYRVFTREMIERSEVLHTRNVFSVYFPTESGAVNKIPKSSSKFRKLGTMKSAPTRSSRALFQSSTRRHSGSAVATPTAVPPAFFTSSIST